MRKDNVNNSCMLVGAENGSLNPKGNKCAASCAEPL